MLSQRVRGDTATRLCVCVCVAAVSLLSPPLSLSLSLFLSLASFLRLRLGAAMRTAAALLAARIASASWRRGELHVLWKDGGANALPPFSAFSELWLRDHCRESLHPTSLQRQVGGTSSSIPRRARHTAQREGQDEDGGREEKAERKKRRLALGMDDGVQWRRGGRRASAWLMGAAAGAVARREGKSHRGKAMRNRSSE